MNQMLFNNNEKWFASGEPKIFRLSRNYINRWNSIILKHDGFVKSPDAALRRILRHCGVRQVRLFPQDLRALPAELFTRPSKWAYFPFFYKSVRQDDRSGEKEFEPRRSHFSKTSKHVLFALLAWILLAGPAMARTPERIISLAPNLTEILYDLGLGERVIAVSRYCNYPPEVKTKPTIGGMSNPSLEAIVAMRPEMVVLTDDGNPRQIERRLRQVGIRTHVFRAKRLADLPGEIRALGTALDVTARAERSAARIESVIHRHTEKTQRARGFEQKKVLFVVQPDPLIVAGPGTAIDDVLQLLGIRNIAAHAKTPYPRYSLEEVIRQSPDIIFMGMMQDAVMDPSRRLLGRLSQVDAVRLGRVYYIGDPLFRLGPRITEGISEIAGMLEKVTN